MFKVKFLYVGLSAKLLPPLELSAASRRGLKEI